MKETIIISELLKNNKDYKAILYKADELTRLLSSLNKLNSFEQTYEEHEVDAIDATKNIDDLIMCYASRIKYQTYKMDDIKKAYEYLFTNELSENEMFLYSLSKAILKGYKAAYDDWLYTTEDLKKCLKDDKDIELVNKETNRSILIDISKIQEVLFEINKTSYNESLLNVIIGCIDGEKASEDDYNRLLNSILEYCK